MRIHLVRHAQSDWQTAPSQEWDSSLTPVGHEQSRQLARWLAERPSVGDANLSITSLLVSPLRRAQQTARHLADVLSLAPVTCEALREADFHVAEHLPQRDHPSSDHLRFVASERYASLKGQANDALQVLVREAEAASGAVLAVTHGGLMKTLLRTAMGTDAVCFRLYNACLTVIEWRRGRWHLVHLNLWDHLPPALRTE